MKKNNNNNKNNNKRRFSDEQIRLLETTFKSETKLEPRKKVEVARDVGLEPRQVGVWFQNKRARLKSKQLEQEYAALRAKYDTLASQFRSLEMERQTLLSQLQLHNLSQMLGDSQEDGHTSNKFMEGSISHSNNNYGHHIECATDDQQQQEELVEGRDLKKVSIGDNPESFYYRNFEPGGGGGDGGGLLDISCSINNSKWLDFWT